MSTVLCGSVANTEDQLKDCDNLPVMGMESYAIIMDHADYLNATVTEANDIISAIVLPVGSQAIEAQTPSNYAKERFTASEGESGNAYYEHALEVIVPNTAAGKKFAKEAGNGKYVIIAEKKAKGADKEDAFEVLGVDSGLRALSSYDSEAMDGYILIPFVSKKATDESAPPKTFLDTDYATSVLAVQALLVPSS